MPTQNIFRQSLFNPQHFTITYELVPGQGSGGQRIEALLEFARAAHTDGRITALSITDNPGGHPALAPIAIGTEVRALGIEPMIHFSLKDKNRNQVESHLFLYHRQQLHTLLVLGGDYPRSAYYGQAKPVFDLDSVQTLQLLRDMEDGSYKNHFRGGAPSFTPLSMLRGCVVSPFKTTEAEQVWQYAKLLRKVRAGANFIVTQLGYDVAKYQELIIFMREAGVELPVLANVFIPSLKVARLMARGGVPGIVVPPQLVRVMEEEARTPAADRARLLRAARMIHQLRQLGYAGVHLGGNNLTFDKICFVLDAAQDLAQSQQEVLPESSFAVPHSWYLYPLAPPPAPPVQTPPQTPLQTPLQPGQRPGALAFHRLCHGTLFAPRHLSARLFGQLCRLAARHRWSRAAVTLVERLSKVLLFSCRMCGDCTLPESTYLCPQSGCPKKLVNGPCGGSRNLACEVFADRSCFWVKIYHRLDERTTIAQLGQQPPLPPKDWALEQTSSWLNYFTGRDHHTPWDARTNQPPEP